MQFETLQKDMIAAMKDHNKERKDAISSVIQAIKKVDLIVSQLHQKGRSSSDPTPEASTKSSTDAALLLAFSFFGAGMVYLPAL